MRFLLVEASSHSTCKVLPRTWMLPSVFPFPFTPISLNTDLGLTSRPIPFFCESFPECPDQEVSLRTPIALYLHGFYDSPLSMSHLNYLWASLHPSRLRALRGQRLVQSEQMELMMFSRPANRGAVTILWIAIRLWSTSLLSFVSLEQSLRFTPPTEDGTMKLKTCVLILH